MLIRRVLDETSTRIRQEQSTDGREGDPSPDDPLGFVAASSTNVSGGEGSPVRLIVGQGVRAFRLGDRDAA